MCYLCFEMQGFKRKQIKMKLTGTFVVCRHTTKWTKVLYRVLTHGKEATCQQSVDLRGVFEPNGRKTVEKYTVKFELHGKGRHMVKSWSPHPATQMTHGSSQNTVKVVCAQTHGKDMLTWTHSQLFSTVHVMGTHGKNFTVCAWWGHTAKVLHCGVRCRVWSGSVSSQVNTIDLR
jgi:hypothetical protein